MGGDRTKARIQAAIELADRLFDAPEAERRAVLDRAEPEIRAEAERLLEADARECRLLSGPVGRWIPSALRAVESGSRGRHARVGAMMGPFRLVSLLGEGGMGEVWVGERTGADFRQRVAVKVLPPHGNAARLAARFRMERRILARLTHPRIASLLDGGTTEDGTPWLAMEYVEGLSLTDHCASRALTVEERLQLFAKVCEAVQFAHRNLVVHRDLKPGNILVGPGGEPKLLDFGIAKLLEEDAEEDAPGMLTRTGERPMTPDYAAPEQVRGERATTATDVWALGIILHELLTGVRPYRASSKSVGEIERLILEASPSRPSTSTKDRSLRRRLRGDLDAIVLKALRARPEDRYPSVEALASDVRRHLEGLPVTARGETATYLLRSFVRRYRLAVTLAGVGLAALLAGLAGTLWQAHRAREEARKAVQTREFLVSMLRAFDPEERGGHPLSQREILARGEERVGQELGDQPEAEAQLRLVFAETWLGLANYDRALAQANQALDLDRKVLGPRSEEVAQTLLVLSAIDSAMERLPEAERAAAEALSIAREVEGQEGPSVARALAHIARAKCRNSEFAEADATYERAIEISRHRFGDEHPRTLDAMNDLAECLGDEGRFDRSIPLYQQTTALSVKVRGAEHPETLLLRHNLARDLIELGRYDEAAAILRDVFDKQREVFGPDMPGELGGTKRMLGRALAGLGQSEEAIALYDDAIQAYTESQGPESFMVAQSLWPKSDALRHLGKLPEAETTARAALRMCLDHLNDDRLAARIRTVLAATLLEEGRAAEARDELVRALAVLEKVVPVHPVTIAARAALGRAEAAAVQAR